MTSSTLKIVGLFLLLVVIIVFSVFGLLKGTVSSGGLNKEEVEKIVSDYISTNPELIIKSLTQYQQQAQDKQDLESQKSITEKKNELENDASSPVAGNPKGDVVIVEFFDYSCGYCKKVLPSISELLKEDKNIKVIFKEFPILGPNSLLASQAAIAVYQLAPEKYFDYYSAAMKEHISGKDSILKITTNEFIPGAIDLDEFKARIKAAREKK
ncbi:MAG: bdbD 1 [Rickettsiaceae bacterium]|nr:bdbD 1 [Rickettsiaceae bacterium]